MTQTIQQFDKTIIRHGYDCPAFVNAVVTRGTPPKGSPVALGELPLDHGTIEFRHRLTKAVLASMSTAAGATLNATVGACEMVITPAALASRTQTTIEVAIYSDAGVLTLNP